MDNRTCEICGIAKPEDQFSLKVGKHDSLRKLHCMVCEARIRKARRYGLSVVDMDALLKQPCYTCGQPSSFIHLFNKQPKGALCKRCHDFAKTIELGSQLPLQMANYFTIIEKFPFLLASASKKVEIEYVPLLDYIESRE